jgi:gluconate 5-dehydrogenase
MAANEPTIQQLFDLSDKVALITGGRGWLGSAMARGLAEAGARVVVGSRNEQSARDAAAQLPNAVAGHFGVPLDHMDEDSLARGFAAAVARAGRIDVLINNGHEALPADWRAVTGAEFTRQLGNATGYFLLARLFRDHIVERHAQGSVVLLGSMYGLVGSYPDAYADICPASPAAYHALKGAVVHLTRHLAVYWAKDGVRVNCLSPGPFPPPRVPGELVERLSAKSPLGRMGAPHELKGAIVFLASDASSYLTGQNLVIDGGWTAW